MNRAVSALALPLRMTREKSSHSGILPATDFLSGYIDLEGKGIVKSVIRAIISSGWERGCSLTAAGGWAHG
jgi:hypothetical protein